MDDRIVITVHQKDWRTIGWHMMFQRQRILHGLESQGYTVHIKLMDASRFGVPQKRLRVLIVAIRNDQNILFTFPEGSSDFVSVGESLRDMVSAGGWEGAERWAEKADKPAPAIVGGSKKHGGADLGPVRARKAWEQMGVDGRGVADNVPERGAGKAARFPG